MVVRCRGVLFCDSCQEVVALLVKQSTGSREGGVGPFGLVYLPQSHSAQHLLPVSAFVRVMIDWILRVETPSTLILCSPILYILSTASICMNANIV